MIIIYKLFVLLKVLAQKENDFNQARTDVGSTNWGYIGVFPVWFGILQASM